MKEHSTSLQFGNFINAIYREYIASHNTQQGMTSTLLKMLPLSLSCMYQQDNSANNY